MCYSENTKPNIPVHIEHVQEDQRDLRQEIRTKGACNTCIGLSENK